MSAHDEALRRIARARETNAEWLDLGDLGLNRLPKELGDLPALRTLALGRMKIVEEEGRIEWEYDHKRPDPTFADLTPLTAVPWLCSLSLHWCTGVTDVGPLAALTRLERLDLSHPRITDVSPLAALTQLRSLNLARTSITDVRPLAALTQLQFLDLAGCEGIRDASPLAALARLQYLDLWKGTGIADVSPLAALTQLWSLNLARTSITDLRPLAALTQLQSLDLHSCEGVTDVRPLAALIQLQSLKLAGTGITDVGPLAALTELRALYLQRCQRVTDVGPLAALIQLRSLNLARTGVTDVRPLAALAQLRTLDLGGCEGLTDVGPLAAHAQLQELDLGYCKNLTVAPLRPLLEHLTNLVLYQSESELPAELSGQFYGENVLDAVKAHYTDLSVGPAVDAELKVFLLGNGGVGKTQLCLRLREQPFDRGVASTHGIQLGHTDRMIPGIGVPVRLNLWDFGGQDIYHGTHALFLQDRTVFLLLWHPDMEVGGCTEGGLTIRHRPLAYWLDYIRSTAGKDAALVLVQSKCEDATQQPLPAPLPEGEFVYVENLAFAAANDWGKKRLEACLEEAVQTVLHKRPPHAIGVGRVEVRAQLRQMLEEDQRRPKTERRHRTLSRKAFDQLCAANGKLTSPGALLEFLHRQGVVFYRAGLFGDRIILDQSWALDAIYAIFHRQKTLARIREREGRFTREELGDWLWDQAGHTVEEQELFLSFMESCGTCFRVGFRGWNRQYIAPELLPEWSEAEARLMDRLTDAPTEPAAVVRYRFLHEGILPGFLSKLGEQARESAVYWKYGCYFFEAQTRSKVLVQSRWLDDPKAPGAGEVRFRVWGDRPAELLDPLLKELLAISTGQLPEVSRAAAAEPYVPDGSAGIEALQPQLADPRLPGPKQVYLSYAWGEDKSPEGLQREEVVDRVCDLLERDGYQVFRDKKSMRHGDQISKFMLAIGRGSRVVVILSDKYLRSPHCMHELYLIYQRALGDKEEFLRRIVTGVLDDARIDGWKDRVQWRKHWKEIHDQMYAERDHLGLADEAKRRLIEHWYREVGDMLAYIADTIAPHGFDAIVAGEFAAIRAMLERGEP